MSFYRRLLRWPETVVKGCRCCREDKIHSNCWRCCAQLGGHMAVYCRAILLREGVIEGERTGLLEKGPSYAENSLRVSESCNAF